MFGDKAESKYFKLDDGATIALVGDEVTGNASYDELKKRYVADPDGGFRFGVNIWDGEKITVLEGGWRLYKALSVGVKAHGDGKLFRVSKLGSGMDVKFSAEPVRDLTDEEKERIASADRISLSQALSWTNTTPVSTDEIPF